MENPPKLFKYSEKYSYNFSFKAYLVLSKSSEDSCKETILKFY